MSLLKRDVLAMSIPIENCDFADRMGMLEVQEE